MSVLFNKLYCIPFKGHELFHENAELTTVLATLKFEEAKLACDELQMDVTTVHGFHVPNKLLIE